jgi:hypothetical protein
MKRTLLAGLMAATLWSSFALAAPGDGVAFLTDLKGEAKVDGAARPPIMSELARGQKLALGQNAQMSVMFIQSGEEFLLKGPGEFEIDKAGKTVAQLSKTGQLTPRKTDWQISSQALVKVTKTASASIRMRGSSPTAVPDTKVGALLYPVRGSITTLQPVLTWQASGSGAADVSIALASDPDKAIVAGKGTGGSHKFSTRLAPETDYVWSVNAGGTELGRGKFRTLSTEQIAMLDKRRPNDKAAFSDRLLYAVTLNDLGVTQEAQTLWAKLAAERSDLPELASLGRNP